MRVERLSPVTWNALSERAHLIVFGETKPASWDRYDFTLLVVEEDTPLMYATCREVGADYLHLQYGGAFPSSKGSVKAYKAYLAILDWIAQAKYKHISMRVENDNKAMLKFALHTGFKIVGVRNFKGTVLLEHLKDLEAE